jgi:hypothetical protein
MGLIDSARHPDRKRQENWQRFSREVGGTYISEGPSGGNEIHIPFMGHRITVSTQTEGRAKRTVMSAQYSNDDLQFKIFGWGGRKVPEVDRDPYLNSEFPDLAPRVKVEFNDAKKLTRFLASADLRELVLEAPACFTLEAKPGSVSLDNRAHGSIDHGNIIDVDQLHAAFDLMKCALLGLEAIESAPERRLLVAA